VCERAAGRQATKLASHRRNQAAAVTRIIALTNNHKEREWVGELCSASILYRGPRDDLAKIGIIGNFFVELQLCG
jgi:hypothetical protein